MIRRYCDMCDQQIVRNVVTQRFKPTMYSNTRCINVSLEVAVKVGTTWNQGELCLPCLRRIVAHASAEERT